MNAVLLITLSGVDRPGLVSELAEVVSGLNANWEHSRMMHLSGRFVGLLEIHLDSTKEDRLVERLGELKDLELTIARGSSSSRGERVFELSLVGADHPGIVSEISEVLVKHGLNIEALSTATEAAADSGTPLFRAHARLTALTKIDVQDLRMSLEAIAHDLMVEVDIAES